MEPSDPPPARIPWRCSPLLAAGLGWILPGLGHLYVGRPVKAALFLIAILSTFLLGWHLTDYVVVDPSRYRLDYIAQILLGGPTLFIQHVLGPPAPLAHMPRFFDVGRLYVNVAGLLNFVAICDAMGDAILKDRYVLALRMEARERGSDTSVTALAAEVLTGSPTEPPVPAAPSLAQPFEALPSDARSPEARHPQAPIGGAS